MNYLYPWSMHFKISDEQLSEWEKENTSHLPLAVWAIGQGKLQEHEFQSWAQNFYSLPVMKSEFFQQPASKELWVKCKEMFVWTDVLVPLYEWDNTLFVGCIEPARNLDLDMQVQFVLCRHDDLALRWHQYQNSENVSSLRQVAFNDELENPVTQNIDLRELEAQENKISGKSIDKEEQQAHQDKMKETQAQKTSEPPAAPETPPTQSTEAAPAQVSEPVATSETIEVPPPPPSSQESIQTAPQESTQKATQEPKVQTLGTVKLNLGSLKSKKGKSANDTLAALMNGEVSGAEVTEVKASEGEGSVQPPSPPTQETGEAVAVEPPQPPPAAATDEAAEFEAVANEPETKTEEAGEATANDSSQTPEAGGLEGLNLEAMNSNPSAANNKDSFDFNQLAAEQGISVEKPENAEASGDEPIEAVPEGLEGVSAEAGESAGLEGLSQQVNVGSLDFSMAMADSQESSNIEQAPEKDTKTPPPPPPQAQEINPSRVKDSAAAAQPTQAPPPPSESGEIDLNFDSGDILQAAMESPTADTSAVPPSQGEKQTFASDQSFQEDNVPPEIEKSVIKADTNTTVQLENVKNIDDLASFIFGKMDKHFERKLLYVNYRGQGFEPIRWSEHWFATKTAKRSVIDVKNPNMFAIAHRSKKPFHGQVAPNEINDQFFVRWNKGQYLPAMTIYPVVQADEVIAFFVGTPRSMDFTFDALHLLDDFAQKVAPALSVINTLAA